MRTPRHEAELAAVVAAIFRRWPSLVGFSVAQVPARGLVVSDVETLPWLSESPDLLFGEIAGALREFTEDEPGARELLRGRTFARTLH